MAGSFASIVDDRGDFTMDLIENLGDAEEALHECFHIIRLMAGDPHHDQGDASVINRACDKLKVPRITVYLRANYLFDRLGDMADEENTTDE